MYLAILQAIMEFVVGKFPPWPGFEFSTFGLRGFAL